MLQLNWHIEVGLCLHWVIFTYYWPEVAVHNIIYTLYSVYASVHYICIKKQQNIDELFVCYPRCRGVAPCFGYLPLQNVAGNFLPPGYNETYHSMFSFRLLTYMIRITLDDHQMLSCIPSYLLSTLVFLLLNIVIWT